MPSNLYIIAGNFCVKHRNWNNIKDNPYGKALNKWSNSKFAEYKLSLCRSGYSSFTRGNSYIDLILANNRFKFLDNELKNNPYDSDCKPPNGHYNIEKQHKINGRNTNWINNIKLKKN